MELAGRRQGAIQLRDSSSSRVDSANLNRCAACEAIQPYTQRAER